MIYLDYAATSPVSKEVADAVCQTLIQDFSNPSAQYAPGLRVKQRLEDWRGIISNGLLAKSPYRTAYHYNSRRTQRDIKIL